MPEGPTGFPVTLVAQQSTASTCSYSYQAGYLAPPAYDVNEVSDDDDDPDVEEIEALLRDLKALKRKSRTLHVIMWKKRSDGYFAEATVTVTEIKA